MLDRRTFTAAALAFMSAGSPAAGAAPHPDAELLAAWEAYAQHLKFCDTLPMATMTDADWKPYNDETDRLSHLIAETPARTPVGLAVKMKRLLSAYTESLWAENAVIYGPTEETFQELAHDFRDRMLWQMIAEAERMSIGCAD